MLLFDKQKSAKILKNGNFLLFFYLHFTILRESSECFHSNVQIS